MENEDREDEALWPSCPADVMKAGVYGLIGVFILGAVAVVCLSLDREQPRTAQVSK